MLIQVLRAMSLSGLACALMLVFPPALVSQANQAGANASIVLAPYGNCAAPSKEGVHVCAPFQKSEVNAPFQVIAAGTSGRGQVTFMELWADGKKIATVRRSPFDVPMTLSPGTHVLTVVEGDETGAHAKSAPVTVQVNAVDAETCAPPSLPGVNVCEPMPNGCNTSGWIGFLAAGTGKSGTVARMELWVNGAKLANFPGDHFFTNMVVYGTNYPVGIYEVDSQGHTLGKSFPYFGPC